MNYKQLRTKRKLSTTTIRVIVSKSNKNIVAQVFDPVAQSTLFTSSSLSLSGTKTEKSTAVGKLLVAWLKDSGISKVTFDRNGNIYHGRIAAVAESIRESGVKI